jgi:hypothetical protein
MSRDTLVAWKDIDLDGALWLASQDRREFAREVAFAATRAERAQLQLNIYAAAMVEGLSPAVVDALRQLARDVGALSKPLAERPVRLVGINALPDDVIRRLRRTRT